MTAAPTAPSKSPAISKSSTSSTSGRTRGLAKVSTAGLREASRLGADYAVNLDADNQYDARDIPQLLAPLREGKADIVVGERPIEDIPHFSFVKKKLGHPRIVLEDDVRV